LQAKILPEKEKRLQALNYLLTLTCSTSWLKPVASLIAMSANILRLILIPDSLMLCMSWL
jgi:hypothetical protein